MIHLRDTSSLILGYCRSYRTQAAAAQQTSNPKTNRETTQTLEAINLTGIKAQIKAGILTEDEDKKNNFLRSCAHFLKQSSSNFVQLTIELPPLVAQDLIANLKAKGLYDPMKAR